MRKQQSKNLELRYVSHDPKANGETDFKGETSTLSTKERIDYLNEYARRLPHLFDDFSLDVPAVSLDATRERPYYVTGHHKVWLDPLPALHSIKIELDFVYHKWNRYFNGLLQADFVDFPHPIPMR